MVRLSRYEKLQKVQNAETYKPLLDDLTQCNEADFLEKLRNIQEWDRSRDDLFVWTPVLNRMDDMMSEIVKKYSYKTSDFKKYPVKLVEMSKEDEATCVDLMEFTARLLCNTENRYIYSSMDNMDSLLNCPNFKVKLCAVKVLAIMGERYIIARERIQSDNILGDSYLKKKALKLALCLPSSTMDDDGDHFSLVDLYFGKKTYPSKWSKLKYTYYTPVTSPGKAANSGTKDVAGLSSPMKKFSLSKDELRSHSLQQLFDKGMEILPAEDWFEYSLRVTISKAFSDDTYESKELRNIILRTKFNAMALVNTIFIPPQVSSKMFELDPYAFNSLTDFISLSETKVPKELRLDCLFALECVSLKHVWCSDIVRNMGGNMSHGLLSQILRYIGKILRENSPEVDEEYNVRFFYLISNLADVKTLHESLVSAGLISSLLDIISVKRSNYRRTLASATHLLEAVINDGDSTAEFINNNGFNILINSFTDEVNFALENPDYGSPPKYSLVYYSVSFRQLAYIRSLSKLVLKLLKTDSGDRIRNLIDSPILVSLRKILENRPVFGYTLITYVLDIIQRVINSEPTIYPILVEAGIVPYIINHFSEFMGPYSGLISILPDVISALCLNTDGLKQVKEKNMISFLFEAVTKPEYARILSWKEEATDLGASVDELARHYPELRSSILDCFVEIVNKLPRQVEFNQPYLYTSANGGELFYQSKDEPVIEYEENAEELAFWDVQKSTPIVDCFADIFYGMTLENSTLEGFVEKIDFESLLSIIVMERPPFDYTTSQALLNFTDVLQLFDEQQSEFAFPAIMKVLDEDLQSVRSFLTSNNETSFLLQTKADRDNTDIEELLAKLHRLSTLLYIVTDAYVSITSLSEKRILQIMHYLQKAGFGLIENLGLLFQKCALEEMYLTRQMPDQAITLTQPSPIGNVPPVQIHVTKPTTREYKDNYTSAKLKNSLEVRAVLNKAQSCTAMLFRCLLRLSHAKNIELESSDRALEVHIFDETTKQIVSMMQAVQLENNIPYFLVLADFNNHIFTFPRTTVAGMGMIQTVPAYLFYQNGGYKVYFEALKVLFDKVSKFTDMSAVEEVDYLKNSEDILTLSCLLNMLNFFNKSMQFDSMENISSVESFYPHMLDDYNLTKALMVLVKILALGLIFELSESGLIFNRQRRSVPYAACKQVLTLLKNIFSDTNEEDEEFFELRWDLIPPSRRKIQLLKACGMSEDAASVYLLDNDDELPSHEKPAAFNEDQWLKYQSILKNDTWQLHPLPLEPQYEQKSSKDDFDTMRNDSFTGDLVQKVFDVLPNYPKLVNAFARTLLQMLENYDKPCEKFAAKVLDKVLETDLHQCTSLSSLIHLFGIFLNEKYVYENSEDQIHRFLAYLQQSLNPEHINSPWFSKALYVYEIILAKSEVPAVDPIPPDVNIRYRLPPMTPVYRISPDAKKSIFDALIRAGEISSFYSALATCRILIFYARDEIYAGEIARSGILSRLLKVIGVFQKSEKINYLESSFLLLARRCFETSQVVELLIRYELNRSFTTRIIGDHKEKERDLTGIVEEKPHVVLRNPDTFVDIICERARFQSFNDDGKLTEYNLLRSPNTEETEESESKNHHSPTASVSDRTGIVHLLLTQLIAASKKDWTSEPASTDGEKFERKNDKVYPARNPVCAYMMFLLKVLVELVSSYKQSKFEFLTFDRRNSYNEFPKPRSTALNFFLYQLLDKSTGVEQNKHEAKRREVISMLARSVIVGFVATVQDDKSKKSDLKSIDPDMTFIRKFTIESIVKALKNATTSTKLLEANVSKLDTWFKIISSMVFVQAPYLRLILDTNKIDADQYQICKLMIEMNVPTAITDCMALLDLNYPFCKKLMSNAVDPLNSINSVRNSYAELFKVEGNDDEVEVEEDSDKENPSDMFRNSALGMYDVADIEEDEDDEDSLIGDDEDIAFVDADDDEFEVVFSDENGAEDINASHSEYETDSDESMDSENEGSSSERAEISHDEDGSDGSSSGADTSYDESDDIELISLEGGDYGEELEIDLADYGIEESDWESGLSELSASDEDGEDIEGGTNDDYGHGVIRRRWMTTDGFDVIEDASDEEEATGTFQGIEHVFHSEAQPLFRVQDGRSHGRHHQRSFRGHGHQSLGLPSLTLLNGDRRHQSNLVNPLGPSSLEEVENGLSDQLVNVGSGSRYRSQNTHFAGVLFSGEFFDERAPDGIVLKPTVSRWKDIFDMFYDSKSYAAYVVPTIISRLYKPSLEAYREARRREEEEKERTKMKSPAVKPKNQSTSSTEEHNALSVEMEEEHADHEPVYVIIDGAEVDIGGTDIDAEFLNALPEDIRAEVFAQHVRERRAEAMQNEIHSREIDSDFLDAIPENLREEILGQEAAESRFSTIVRTMHEHENEEMDEEMISGDEGTNGPGTATTDRGNETEKKKSGRVYFSPLVDRVGIAAIMRSIFISQPYVHREIYHELLYRLCSSKQNRSDIINILLIILTEGVVDQHSLEKVYNLICSRAHGANKAQAGGTTRLLPADCTPLVVANQAIEVLQSLIDADNRLKYFFITEHDNLMVNKAPIKNKRDVFNKNLKWPVKYLFALLDLKIITDESVLMDLLTRILQVCTKPIGAIAKNSDDGNSKRKFPIPFFDDGDFEKLVSIIKLESCNTRVFQQTLNIMQNLSILNGAVGVFTKELISMALETVKTLIPDLEAFTLEGASAATGNEINSELVQKFTVPSSDQARLLKVLTAVDYIHSQKKTMSEGDVSKLMVVYEKMNLGEVWSSLSKCLFEFERQENLSTSATVLLPLIESLMVVFKHGKAPQNKAVTLKYEDEKKLQIAQLPVDQLFFHFTEAHKKLLNQMIRSNPKLMSGPFALLVKNPKVLDFDNKRYFFIAKLGTETHDRPKLSITVRREQVFLDSYRALFFKSNDDIKKSKLEITFKGESGVDAGGLTREWYQVLSRQMFNPDYALFLPVESDKTTFRPNRTSGINPEHLSFFKFIGMIIGKAIRDQCFLDCHFSREVYKNILGRPVSLKDMESLDLDYYKSLVWILENDITDVIEETFSVETDDYGEHKIIELVENGKNVPVTEANKQDYVKKIVEYKLHASVKEQMDNFLQGFYALIPIELISIFDEQELELLVSGLPDIDVDDWKNNTTYVNYTANCKQINYFWRAVRSFDAEERAKLLQFVTGTSKVPLNGFKELTGVTGVCKFSIHRDYGSTDRLPSSHTCFNQLNLPAYSSYETLRGSLLLSINEGHEGFGIA
ncbi:hypothetical protein HG536_0A05970 [Torulaspora globosa]|uniref:HECT-type E3 ubiquitin transferase n=1 Tax=Torulaspora globosa TaxID=48254 RepID=A0A7G3ZB96_9SACH|nr:uncharacterized protein HG536_0A05970 [Torulaspora globosa]QLL30782.1 hypothetical protein HG536_0A05970 [Torulaspora globosa]